jgi:formylglycine-generating enzyme required for sulfatase activity
VRATVLLFFVTSLLCFMDNHFLVFFLCRTLVLLCSLTAGTSSFADDNKLDRNLDKVANDLGMSFVRVSAGSYWRGSDEEFPYHDSDEGLQQVVISKSFYLQATEVTQGQWVSLMQGNPSAYKGCGVDCPVERVEFEWIAFFIEKLNRLEPGISYRLPTEAEWEYAARAGSNQYFSVGSCLRDSDANVSGSKNMNGCPPFTDSRGPKPVASYAPNRWGLYDMHGNVWEICSDWYAAYPDGDGPLVDPAGPISGQYKVLRGGSWQFYPEFARSANRLKGFKSIAGFRLVRMEIAE